MHPDVGCVPIRHTASTSTKRCRAEPDRLSPVAEWVAYPVLPEALTGAQEEDRPCQRDEIGVAGVQTGAVQTIRLADREPGGNARDWTMSTVAGQRTSVAEGPPDACEPPPSMTDRIVRQTTPSEDTSANTSSRTGGESARVPWRHGANGSCPVPTMRSPAARQRGPWPMGGWYCKRDAAKFVTVS